VKALDRALQMRRFQQVLPFVGAGTRILDVGCANGALARYLGSGYAYVGVDPDAPISDGFGPRLIRDTFPTRELSADEQFDVIVALAVLEHVPSSELTTFAAACVAHLSAGGRLVLTVPVPLVDRIIALLKHVRMLDGMREDQHHGYAPAGTPALFESHGLRLEHYRRFECGLNNLFVFQRG
jgi:SAM-dependent methyltransferase